MRSHWVSAFIVASLALATSVRAEDSVEAFTPVGDKTLVAWVSPSNLTQQGGSVLTLEDAGGRFDALVFGEIASGKWMAGSEMFSRTQREQDAYALESAGPEALVQVALVYERKRVTLYRDGVVYARYRMASSPHAFSQRSVVIMGKRHRQQGGAAFFAGEIDDARIYDRALNLQEIVALQPNRAGEATPWAWWDFESDATEKTGRFLDTQLQSGAMVKAGRLVLDGVDDLLLAKSGKVFPFTPEHPKRPNPAPENWLSYHLAHPGPGEAMPGDPNCAFYWKGRYHLHYIYNHKDGFSFAHVSSTDLLHWEWHPTTLTPPKTEHGMFSGTGFFTKEGRPAIIYHGEGFGRNQIAIALDDQLEQWSEPMPLEPTIQPGQDASLIAHWDPDAWLDGDTYYALSGGSPGSGKPPTLFRSPDLKSWDYLGLFLSHDMPSVQPDEDISCPNFFPIGNKRMLLCISHNLGCRYYLGDWREEKFHPDFHARMNWKKQDGQNWGGDFFAPESLLTADGRRVMWAWCILKLAGAQSGIQSLPRELSLPEDGVLRIKPLRELETLRRDEQHFPAATLTDGKAQPLPGIKGDALELRLRFNPQGAQRFGLRVHADAEGTKGCPILVDTISQTLTLGTTIAPFTVAPGESVALRVFVDKDMVEVFANDRQAIVAAHSYGAGETHVSLTSEGGVTQLEEATAWRMAPIWP